MVALGAYLWYALRCEVAKRLRREPSEDDLALLATEVYPRYQTLVTTEREVLTDLFRVVFEFERRCPSAQTRGGDMLIVNGSAALAALVGDSAELDEIVTSLESWYNENAEDFQRLDPLGS